MESSLVQQIQRTFPEVLIPPEISDSFIEENQLLFDFDFEEQEFKIVPAYMLWCLRAQDCQLVGDNLVHMFAEFGRTKPNGPFYLRFMHKCSSEQALTVCAFLEWYSKADPVHHEKQLNKALSNWKAYAT